MKAIHLNQLNEILIDDVSDSLDENKKLLISFEENNKSDLKFSFRGGFEKGAINVTFSEDEAKLIKNTLQEAQTALKSRKHTSFPHLEIKGGNSSFTISRDVLGEPFREVVSFGIEIGDPSKAPTKSAYCDVSYLVDILKFFDSFTNESKNGSANE